MRCAPPHHRTLARHGSERQKEKRNWPARGERLVRAQAVIPNRDSQTSQHIHAGKNDEVGGIKQAAPQQTHGCQHAKRRKHHGRKHGQLHVARSLNWRRVKFGFTNANIRGVGATGLHIFFVHGLKFVSN